jgi:hypothetical protein
MKKKQFMSKLAALTMAAAMGLTAVPATALNVMASTAVTSTTKDDEAAAFPPTATVEGWLDTLTATQASDKLKTITTDVVKSTIATNAKIDASSINVTEDTAKKQEASNADKFAYRTFNITLTNSADKTTRDYTAVLTAETLTDDETKGILPTYLQNEIGHIAFTRGSAAASQLTDAVKDAVKSFNDKYKTAVATGTVSLDRDGHYTISFTKPEGTSNVTGTVNFDKYKDSQVSVENKTNGTTSGRKTLKDAVLSMNINISASPYYNSTTKTYDTDKIASDVTTALGHGFTAQNVSVTDADNWSFEAYDSTGTYKVTIGTGADLETDNSALKTALDNYFASNEIKTAKNKTLRNTDIAALVNADDAVTAAKKTYTIDGDGNALGSDGSGKLTIKNGSTTYTYAFTADVKVSEETEAEANKKALATVNATTYPEYRLDGTVKYDQDPGVSHDVSLLSKKLLSDLKDAGYNTAGKTFENVTGEPADKSTNGEYKTVISPNNDVVDVSLAYSSDQKLQDTEKALEKFLAKGSTKAANSTAYTEHKAATGVKLDDVIKPADEYSFATTSALSQKVQSKKAVKATSAADAADIVKAAIDEQLKASGVADNGVGVTVKAVNTAAANADDASKYDVTKAADATVADEGTIKLLVTASIKNDFYGWSDGTNKDTAKTVSYSYLMDINTNQLKENKAKTISLADKTVLLSGGYYTTKKSDYQADRDEVTYVEITPVIDPEDANTAVTYKVYDSDDSLVTDEVQISDTNAVYKKGSDTAVKAGTNALGLKITKTGTYTIKAAAGDAEATMKLTVKKNFDDVSATAYYKDAVVWAYGNGVTSGVTQDIFGVNTDVTRAQYVTWLYRYAVSQDSNVAIKDADVKGVFSDVAATAYYAKAVQWAKETDVTSGKTDSTFAPNATITRAEAVTMLWRAYGKPSAGIGSETEKTVKFTDVPANAYYTTAVTWALGKDITNGTSTTTFSPNKSCSRAEGITFIYNLYR